MGFLFEQVTHTCSIYKHHHRKEYTHNSEFRCWFGVFCIVIQEQRYSCHYASNTTSKKVNNLRYFINYISNKVFYNSMLDHLINDL